ncbi:interferon-inducible GTPase [Grosmannia clavigera kw1407]|uniref:Interferon-inducible GTPase n=1 Tax=Grosmannia clavigera (strain kw1407 / UAMH 11150) TaxID=655863 RepID=F0XH96_GROCL|nr:interferon-inducible GTPase [Grosmannia clavigera kw1407]EFX03143.1 interferon-inducible GTPase [Grosmannia clavigera kw1407]
MYSSPGFSDEDERRATPPDTDDDSDQFGAETFDERPSSYPKTSYGKRRSGPSWSEETARSATKAGKGLAVGIGAITAGAVYTAMFPVKVVSSGFIRVSENVLAWATSINFEDEPTTNQEAAKQTAQIMQDREREGFDEGYIHVAVCGPAGSGKSSIINALRGLKNKDATAAATGTVETTQRQQKYEAHHGIGCIMLYDCPGAGTLRNPAEDYGSSQKLHIFNVVLIVLGERFGEIELDIIRSCVARQQPFFVIQSRADERTRRIERDEEIELCEAKRINIKKAQKAFKSELRRGRFPEEQIRKTTRYYMLVNNTDLRKFIECQGQWPEQEGPLEIHEKQLIEVLRRLAEGRTL